MEEADSSEEDSKPPAQNPTALEQHAKPTTKRKRPGDSEAGNSQKKSPLGVQNVASSSAAKRAEFPTAATAKPAAASKTKKGFVKRPPSSGEGSASRRPRQRRRATEEKVPEYETPEEKRLRRNRINDRRKRARRAMKVDFLNEQRQSMNAQNQAIRAENQALREQIAAVRRSQGLVYDNQEALSSVDAEVGQPSGDDRVGDAGARKPSEVLSNAVRSRLDGSILAAMNRQLPAPRVMPAAEEKIMVIPPKASRKGVQHGAPQQRRRKRSGRDTESALASPQQDGASKVVPSLPPLRREPQCPGSPSSGNQEHPNLAMARSASVQQRQQGGLPFEVHHEPPNHGQSSGSVGQDQQSQGLVLSTLQQQPISTSDAPPTSLQQSQSYEPASTVGDWSGQSDARDAILASLYRHHQQAMELSVSPLHTQGGNSFSDSDVLFAALHRQRGQGREASRSTGGESSIARYQQLSSFAFPTETASNSTADILSSFLQNRGGPLTTYQDQLTSSLLRQVVGETKEELPAPEQSSLQGVLSMDALLTLLQQSHEGEAHLLAALQHQRQLQGRGDELTGRSAIAQEPLQSGPQVDALASLLQQRHASLELCGSSFLPQPMETNLITPEVIVALQQLQGGGDRTAPDMARIFQHQSPGQAWDMLPPSRQSNESTEGLLDTLELRYSGSSGIEGVLARLRQPLGGGIAVGGQSSFASISQQESSNENRFAALPGSDGNAVGLVSSLLRGSPSTNSAVQQMLANQGLIAGQAHSSGTALSARTQASNLALSQSILGASAGDNLSPAFAEATAGTSDASRLSLANMGRTALVQELINRSISLPSTALEQLQQSLSGLLASQVGNALQSQAQLAHHQGQQRQPEGEANAAIHSLMLQQAGSRLLQQEQQAQQHQTNQLRSGVASGPSSQARAQCLQEAYYRFMGPQSRSAPRGDEKDDKDASDEIDRHKA